IIILFFLTSCQTQSRFSKNLILSLPADPLTLNPILAQEIPSITVNNFIFNTLLKYNEKMQIAGDLAEKWKVSKDGRIWTFYLRKNIYWHDGFPFTSKDVKFTFDKLFDPSTNTVNRALFQVEGKNIIFKIISPYIIKAVLPASFAPFPAYLTSMGIIPKHLLKNTDINHSEFNIHPIGTGPFKFKYWNHSDHIFLERFPDYFNGSPKIE
ncbi:MAG: peptide-binding protein, partial [Armatimonadetes bacterium]|nr:peptide-binding protein [Armatimonadota bacterium]